MDKRGLRSGGRLRADHDQLVRQVIQGGGNMPAYGKNLSPAEVTPSSRLSDAPLPGRPASPRLGCATGKDRRSEKVSGKTR